MKLLHLTAMGAALIAASQVDAQSRPVGGARINIPSSSNNFSWEHGSGFKGGFGHGGVWIFEREVPVVVEKEVVRDAGPPPPLAPASGPPPRSGEDKRKPYVIGASYASLPGGCMKLIEEGVSFYYCSGDWYRQVGEGRSASYKAVQRKL
jgi:hypothetical protein